MRSDAEGVTPGWLLHEVERAGRENLDPDHVRRYDVKEQAAAVAEVKLLKAFGLGQRSHVIDIGAGTGQFVIAAANECARVTAVDVSPAMLSALTRKVEALALRNVDVVRAGFLTYTCSDDVADIVYSRYALHHLPDFWKAVALLRVHRMLRPGGIFRLWDIVYNFEAAEVFERIESWCSAAGTDPTLEWTRPELEEHVREEHSTFTWVLEPMVERVGFAIEDAEYSDDGMSAKYVLRASG